METELATELKAGVNPEDLPVVDTVSGNPIKSWALTLEEGALDQARSLSQLPFVHKWVALMPDAHQGYGMPIGGVLAAKRAVVPYAIGVDIGCGVVLAETDLTAEQLGLAEDRIVLNKVLQQVLRDVPVGNGPDAQHKEPLEQWIAALPVPPSRLVNEIMMAGADKQLGSLGGGNHFIELQVDTEGRVYVMLHSGSRSLGKKICDFYAKLALELNKKWFSALPDRDLAYLPLGDEFDAYWEAMSFALKFAEYNREAMLNRVSYALERHAGMKGFEQIADCHHNYAAWESHFGENVIVHRKGAVRARVGDDVLIPGSMGAMSYWAEGLGNEQAFMTSPHGAGRQLGRNAAKRQYKISDMESQLSSIGNTLVTKDRNAVLDELPAAYKNVSDVMLASQSLVKIKKELRPVGTVKG